MSNQLVDKKITCAILGLMNQVIAQNRRAYSDYQILEKFEAGVKLSGAEVKSIKAGGINLQGAYAGFAPDNRIYLYSAHVSPYQAAKNSLSKLDPLRPRELLLSKKERDFLLGKLKEKGLTLLPLSVLNKNGLVKIEIGLGRGLKKYEKREAAKKKEAKREIRTRLYS